MISENYGTKLIEALAAFDFGGEILKTAPIEAGHINKTFAVTVVTSAGEKRFLLQRLNTTVFKNPKEVMANITGVTEFLKKKILAEGGDIERETLSVIKTKNGESFFVDSENGFWRCFNFIEDSFCIETVTQPSQFYESAKTFGKFLLQLADYPAETLYETIEKFHDSRKRFRDFEKAVAEDKLGRAKDVMEEIAFVKARKDDCNHLMDRLESGKLPLRVTHNDTKINNIMMDKATGKALCVIDLDTIMPGTAVNDFGDSIRSGATYAAEDEHDLTKVTLDLGLYEAYTKGFLEVVGKALTEEEINCLPWGAKLMTFETGMRFLSDYLEGDIYYNITYEGQNRFRSRTQFKLISDMEKNWDTLLEIGKKYSK